jgi:two-component system cell cycle response regulator CtrA
MTTKALLLASRMEHREHLASLLALDANLELLFAGDLDEGMRTLADTSRVILMWDSEIGGREPLDALAWLRDGGVKTPLILLTEHHNLSDITISSLRLGADDCVPAMVTYQELIARIVAVTHRERSLEEPTLIFDNLALNLKLQDAFVNGVQVKLTGKEYELLALLFAHKGEVVTKEMFLDAFYGEKERQPKLKILDVFICKLRLKLSKFSGGKNYIDTVWGRGYQLIENPQVEHLVDQVA